MRGLDAVLIVPDAHRPYHHERAWQLMLKVGRAIQTKIIVCIGDLLDSYSISDHDKDPDRMGRFMWEVEGANKGLDELDKLGATTKLMCEGNHEYRVVREVRRHPQFYGVVPSIQQLLRLKERGWAFTPYLRSTSIGKIHFTHTTGSYSRTAKFKALDRFRQNIVTGHDHRMVYIVENDAFGKKPSVSAGFGWLGDHTKIDYDHLVNVRATWPLGFGIGYVVRKTGHVHLQPVPIMPDMTCVVNGTLYKG